MDQKMLYRIGVLREVVQAGSFTKAAETLGLSKSVVSQHVTDLEDYLKVRLINRSTRAISITEEGQSLHQCANRILDDVQSTLAGLEAHQETPSGVIRVTASQNFAVKYLTRCLARFGEMYPHVEFELNINDAVMNIIEGRFDIGFRVGWLEDSDLHAVKICNFSMILCASPAYLSLRGPIKTPHDLSHHPWVSISILPDTRFVQLFDRQGLRTQVGVTPKFRTNSGFTAKQFIGEGTAIGLLPDFAVSEDLSEGKLVRLLPDWSHRQGEISAIYVHRDRMPPRIRCFIDYLKQDSASYFQPLRPGL